ncbi:hypothetical protein EW026_g6529 [Hermanssonia centrifuga]|uniref:NAD-dependent epimerase/dehydratase domain-containing protein n=1 Tax=Hermanssonia centrifuga TaxID=98765 RepID=A0A4S4KAQ8_9APHY|nr:hypothetical protein EW026_g6529 [Hermanssonia centrifuga]
MPAVNSGKILVSGANGYIAVWVVKKLLEQGYSEGAFDEAVKDVDAIEHTASPFHLRANDPAELIAPAVAGTGGILQSALKYGTSVKRVVVTSSCAAVLTADPNPRVFTEDDWNELSVKEVETKGSEASAFDKYRASKTLAERAAWAFMKLNADKLHFDLVVLNPPFVFGPTLHEVDDPEKLNSSMHDWWSSVVKGRRDNIFLATIGSAWIDVRDLAQAHVLGIQKENAGGNRIIVSAGPWKWQDWVNAAHDIDSALPAGNTSYDPSKAVHQINYDVSKADKLLGLKYIGVKESTKDMIAQFKEEGWIAT